MASNNAVSNVDTSPTLTETEIPPTMTDPKTLELPLEQNDSRVTDPESAPSPASSTYADCEETGTPSSDNSRGVNEPIVKSDGAELPSETTEESNQNNFDANPYPTTVNEEISIEEKIVLDEADSSINTDIKTVDDIDENVEDKNFINDEINCDPQDEADQRPYEVDDRRRSCSNETGSSECSELDSYENDNDRENGDGQEVTEENAIPPKKLDDDEDRRNPQYIPKRGFFYEHDTRTAGTSGDEEADDGEKKKTEAKEPERKGRNQRAIPDGRWQHDLYRDEEQRPKSTQELVDIYGYNIRNEENAPKARRRRKYGRGPNKYTRQWENEEAYAKQVASRGGQRPRLPRQRDEYEEEFPSLTRERKGGARGARDRDRRDEEPATGRRRSFGRRESSKSDTEAANGRDEQLPPPPRQQVRHNHDAAAHRAAAAPPPPQPLERSRSFTQRAPPHQNQPRDANRSRSRSYTRPAAVHPANRDRSWDRDDSRSRSFAPRIPAKHRDRSPPRHDIVDKMDARRMQKPLRKPVAPANALRSRGRGAPIARSNPRFSSSHSNANSNSNYDGESRSFESRMQYQAAASRARAQPSMRFGQPAKQNVSEDDVHELSHKMSGVDLKSVKRTIINRSFNYTNDIDVLKSIEPNPSQLAQPHGTTAIRSKRYSHQRQRLLPETSGQANTLTNVNVNLNNSLAAPTMQTMTSTQQQQQQHPVSSMTVNGAMLRAADATAPQHHLPHPPPQQLHQHQHQHQQPQQQLSSISYLPQETAAQLRSAPPPAPANERTLAAVNASASAMPPSSLAVSASLIPLSAPPLTASSAGLSSAAPPLPIVGFFQHPQGYTNQAPPAQLYPGEQAVMGAPSNQPVQLVAFLPASPMMQGTNRQPTAAPPPPPPPPPTFAGQVMSYPPQATQAQQPQPSFNSETYSLPPVTLAPMPQAPEMYQSRGGVTYYNTRSQYKPRSPPPPRVKIAIPIVPPPSNELAK